MVHGLTEQFGGRFTLNSRPGRGTNAELWLPIAKSGAAASDNAAAVAQATFEGAPLTIVAVDDDNLVLTNRVAMLEDLGHTVLPASSAQEALQILRRQAVDLVVTDQVMPQMTGVQLADEIRKEWPAVHVILATGYAELAPGDATDVPRLAKPFTLNELADKVAATRSKDDDGRVVMLRPAQGVRNARS